MGNGNRARTLRRARSFSLMTLYVLCASVVKTSLRIRLLAKTEGFGIMSAPGRGAVRLARYNGVVEVDGSNPSAPTTPDRAGCRPARR